MAPQSGRQEKAWNQIPYFSSTSPDSSLSPEPMDLPQANSGVEPENSMTPAEFDRHRRRVWYVETINSKLRSICFDSHIFDKLPEAQINAMDSSFSHLYEPFFLDTLIDITTPGVQNKGLRWRIMSQIWAFLQENIFDQLTAIDKNPLTDPMFTVSRDIVAEKIKQFITPFKIGECEHLDKMIGEMSNSAKQLLMMLLLDNHAKYSFFQVGKENDGEESTLLYSLLQDKAQMVDICGADHRDSSRDIVCVAVTGGLVRRTHARATHETKAWVVLYRPEPDEDVPTNSDIAQTRTAGILR